MKHPSLSCVFLSFYFISLTACNNTPTVTNQTNTPKTKRVQTLTDNTPANSSPVLKISAPSSSIPAWRRPASHTMTRGSDDAIFYAAKKNDMTRIKEILANGTNVDHRNFNGETVLHIAASQGDLSLVEYLVNQGAAINAPTAKMWLPIHHAIRFDHPDVANYLITRKASLLAKTSDGMTALDLAKASKNPQIHAIYEKYAPQKSKPNKAKTL